MEVVSGAAIAVSEQTHVAQARRRAVALAADLQLDEDVRARTALVVTELGTNLLKHAGRGEILVGSAPSHGGVGVQLVAIDRGGGIADVAESLQDGYSTSGTPGTGLGAIRRASNTFGVYSTAATGTILAATVYADRAAAPVAAAICVPLEGELDCGDGWAAWSAGQLTSLFLSDGLGHGTDAAIATRAAVASFRRHAERPALDVVRLVFDALKPTRGAAVAVAALDRREGRLAFCGLGNISGTIVGRAGEVQRMVSYNGIAGHTMRHLNEFNYDFPVGSLVVLHSDGIGASWKLGRYPGLDRCAPDVVAGALYRDFRRGRDDATVVVARNGAA